MLNREISWLDFNSRVLEEAAAASLPWLERLKFIAIFSSNLDEFFMVRIAGLRQMLRHRGGKADPAGYTPQQQLTMLRNKLDKLLRIQHRLLTDEILPGLAEHQIRLCRINELDEVGRAGLKNYFRQAVLPVLTPLTVDPDRPFPMLKNGAVEVAVLFKISGRKKSEHFALVEVPEVLPRFVRLDTAPEVIQFVPLEELIQSELAALFPGCEIIDSTLFRITRDMDLNYDEDAEDLLRAVKHTLEERRSRKPIRLEIVKTARGKLRKWLTEEFQLDEIFRYDVPGMLDLKRFWELIDQISAPELLEAPWPASSNRRLPEDENIFDSIRRDPEILHAVPYETFDPVLRLLEAAASDPAVLAVKQTLYRVSSDSPVVKTLARAARNGKQVTVVVELKARFDEENNIAWGRCLEDAGAQVIYGISGLKIHGKALLILRREAGKIQHYVHLGTGNYNDQTARQYTDLGIFSCDENLCSEISALFNQITGGGGLAVDFSRIAAAPFDLRPRLLALIDREAAHAAAGRPAGITAKLNSLIDPEIIRHLYCAAAAGVKVKLIVRGVCCLRPGVGNDNIRIVSIVDRYLEHSRIYCFDNGGKKEYYLASADWMPRNLDRRIEIVFPVRKPENCRILDRILELELNDSCKGRILSKDGRFRLSRRPDPASRSQHLLQKYFAEINSRTPEDR